jgi:protein-disulfide isomerase
MTYQSTNNISSKTIGQQLRVKLNDRNLFILNKPLEERYQLTLEKSDGLHIIWMRQSCNGFSRLFESADAELAQRIMDVTADALSDMKSFKDKDKYTHPQETFLESILPSKAFLISTSIILVILLAFNFLNHPSRSVKYEVPIQWVPVKDGQNIKHLQNSISTDTLDATVTPAPEMPPIQPTVKKAAPVQSGDQQTQTLPAKINASLTPEAAAEARTLLAERLKNGAAKQEFTIQLSSGHPRTLYIFSDPECPNCKIFEPTVQALSAQYNVEIFPVTLIGKARTAEQVVPLLCAPTAKRADMWRSIFDIGAGMLNPTAKSEPKAASCEAGQNALARNDMAFELYHLPGTPTVISDDGRMIPLQAMTSNAALQAFLNSAQ